MVNARSVSFSCAFAHVGSTRCRLRHHVLCKPHEVC